MTTLLLISRGVVFICVALYAYLFFQRKRDVALHMWLIIIVGMVAGVAGQLIDVYLGNARWGLAQYSVYFYVGLIVYCSWKLSVELKNRRH